MLTELLQRIGLSKYEAEAYLALLSDGPLTGYELGKRSSVPLSKSYEVLERLTRRGLALIQPGEPPRYAAERPERVLAQTRADQEAVLHALSTELDGVQRPNLADDFWVLRGRTNVLARAGAAIDEAQREVVIGRLADDTGLVNALDRARSRGCRVVEHHLSEAVSRPDTVILLVDGREALAGTLSPAAHSQAVVTANPALALAIRGACAGEPAASMRLAEPAATGGDRLDWLAWEARKQQRLQRSADGGRVA